MGSTMAVEEQLASDPLCPHLNCTKHSAVQVSDIPPNSANLGEGAAKAGQW